MVTYILTLSLLTSYVRLPSARGTSKDGFHRVPAGHACSGDAKSQKTKVSVGLTCQCGGLFRGRNCNGTHSMAGKEGLSGKRTPQHKTEMNGTHSKVPWWLMQVPPFSHLTRSSRHSSTSSVHVRPRNPG